MRPATVALALLSATLTLLDGCARASGVELVLVTTTSVGNSGLLDTLLPVYQQNTGVRFGVHLAGSGRALVMLGDGDADVAISHAPEAEAKALAGHPRWWYRKIIASVSRASQVWSPCPSFEAWAAGPLNVHGGVEYQRLGTTTKTFNGGDASKTIGSIGVGFSR